MGKRKPVKKKVARKRGVDMKLLLPPDSFEASNAEADTFGKARKSRVFGGVKPRPAPPAPVPWSSTSLHPERLTPEAPRTPEAMMREAMPSRYGGPSSPPFAGGRPYRRSLPNYLDHAANYLAAVLCEMNGHKHSDYDRSDPWPCTPSLAFAMEQIHKLASHKFTPTGS